MNKFIILYSKAEEAKGKTMDDWMAWFKSIGESVIDSGNPFKSGVEVSASGAKELPMDDSVITGYSIVKAENMEEAVKLLKGCPQSSGIKVYEALPM
jgi:hypothetical protein